MYRFFQHIKVLSFWSFLHLLFLMIGFKVNFTDILATFNSESIYLRLTVIFLSVAPILFVAIAIEQLIHDQKDDYSTDYKHTIGYSLLFDTWPVYKGFDFGDFSLYHMYNTLLFWASTAFFAWSIYTIKPNPIIGKIELFESNEIL